MTKRMGHFFRNLFTRATAPPGRFNRKVGAKSKEVSLPMNIKRLLTVGAVLLFGVAIRANAQEKMPMKLVATTPMPGFTGDFDHFAVDLKGKRLFLTSEDHQTVEVFDLDGKPIKSITGFGQPHAILYMPDVNKFIVTDGDGFGAVHLLSGEDYKILNTIKLPPEVDGAVYNPVDKYYYVESGSGEKDAKTHKINIIDTKAFKLVGDFTLPGTHSEAMAITADGKKMYVNLSTSREVGVVDLAARQLIARWPITGAETPNSMALDEPHHRLFIATRKPAQMVVFDTDTGKIVTTVPISGFNDDMWFDVARKRIYLSGSETTTVLVQKDADHYEPVAEVKTGYRAKTSLYVPQLSRFYAAVSGKGKPEPEQHLAVEVFDVQP
jgi:DNA-binding beta-propeller fold protein YncE